MTKPQLRECPGCGLFQIVPAMAPGLAALASGTWDAVVDTSGYVPRVVRASAELLAARVQRASELIQLCRGRIARAQADVDRVVTDLESLERDADN